MTRLISKHLGDILLQPPIQFRRTFGRTKSLLYALRVLAFYGVWIIAFRLLTLSFITYFTVSPSSRFQDINDAFSSSEVSLMGLSAFLFVALLHGFNPLGSSSLSGLISRDRIERNFVPGFLQGSIFASGLILAFVLSGTYRNWGSFIQLDEEPIELLNILLRIVTLGALVYCEELIFRDRLPKALKSLLTPQAVIHFTAILYCGTKLLQFDLGVMQVITLYLTSASLSYRAQVEGSFARGAGFWAAILIVFQPLLSLPIFGSDFPGILLIKYQAGSGGGVSPDSLNSTPLTRILSGGAGGPLASFAFQLLLILDIARSIARHTKPLGSLRVSDRKVHRKV